jgi:hypothetical protein
MTWLSNLPLSNYRQTYDLNNFVETGCWKGDGIAYAFQTGYKNAHSCDIGLNFVEECRTRFPEASIVHSESMQYFKDLLPTLKGRTLFWLDAHFPEMYGTDNDAEELKIPLIPEIELIKKLKHDYAKDVILCDDMRTFRSKDNPRYREGEIAENLYMDVNWDAFKNILSDTHDAQLINDFDGVMVFTPKLTIKIG